MGDVCSLVKRLSLPQSVAAKAAEYARLATARMGPGGLGQFELCKGAVCVELACMTLGQAVDTTLVARFSGVGEKVYRNGKAALQKVLGVSSKATARDLCIQFGCARHDQSVRAALAAFKERFVKSLPPAQQGRVDFGRPVFLAVAFYLVARKHKVQVDRMKLLSPLGVTATEFAQVCASMADLCADLVGEQQRKRKAEVLADERRALIERTGAADDGDAASDSEDEVEDENEVGFRINAKKQRQREYDEWKSRMLAEKKDSGGGGGSKKAPQLTEKKLRQATLSFGAAAPAAAAGTAGAVAEAGGSGQQPEEQAAAAGSKGQGQASSNKAAGAAKKGSSRGSRQKAALSSKNG
ncbi:hypothetical protein ABPG75_013169 [Micractinium tetrahymenae]